ncbi:GNAT family N-acetyltransferase [Limimaricola soesokkakensis]|uniref:GNAT family N-acetyltransferase n=1 Tax=Limimaricola soesokkakensis TaxID=1343159 RepID=UPI003513289A
MTPTIRRVPAEEAASLLPLLRQGQDFHAARQPRVFWTDHDDASYTVFLEEWLAGEGVVALAAMSATGEMLGCAVFEIEEIPAKPLLKPRRNGLLKHIVVDENCRGAGIGSRLVAEVKARLRAAGIDRLRAHHYAFNEASAAMLRKAGLAPHLVTVEGDT